VRAIILVRDRIMVAAGCEVRARVTRCEVRGTCELRCAWKYSSYGLDTGSGGVQAEGTAGVQGACR
jgi:hypothetical protein